MKIFSFFLMAMIPVAAAAQNVGIGTPAPHASAKVDISSTSSGLLLPRMTTAQRNLIAAPATGLLIFNTDNNSLEMWNATSWLSFGSTGILNNGLPVGPTCTGVWSQKTDFAGTGRYGA